MDNTHLYKGDHKVGDNFNKVLSLNLYNKKETKVEPMLFLYFKCLLFISFPEYNFLNYEKHYCM